MSKCPALKKITPRIEREFKRFRYERVCPSIAYHVTPEKNLKSIMKNGLCPRKTANWFFPTEPDKSISFSGNILSSKNWVKWRDPEEKGRWVLLKLKNPCKTETPYRFAIGYQWEYRYYKPIPPSNLELVEYINNKK